MQERNFERQVKEQMEGFSIPPSAPVWQKIEKEIRRKRDRRRAIFWLLPLLLAGGAVIWLLGDNEPAATQTMNTVQVNEQPETPAAKGPMAPVEDIQQEPVTEAGTSVPYSSPAPGDHRVTTGSSTNATGKKSAASYTSKISKARTKGNPTSNRQTVVDKAPVTSLKKENTSPAPDKTADEVIDATDPVQPVETKRPVTENKTNDPVQVKPETIADTASSTSPSSAPVKRKWKIALQATAGLSQTATALLPGTKMAEPEIVPNSIGYVPPGVYSEPTVGQHYSAGLAFSTSITPQIRFTTGLQYSYASTKQKVGNRVDSVFSSPTIDPRPYYYQNNGTTIYQNRYHFIELPVGIDVRMMTTLPVDLQAGVSVSRLIASNALHYNQQSDTYYTNNDQLQKTTVNLFGGMSYGLFRDRLKVGPQLKYSLVPVTSGEKKQYLMTASVRAVWSLN